MHIHLAFYAEALAWLHQILDACSQFHTYVTNIAPRGIYGMSNWLRLTRRGRLQDHDYPEDVLTYERIALQAGFNAVEALVSDEKQLVGAIAVRA